MTQKAYFEAVDQKEFRRNQELFGGTLILLLVIFEKLFPFYHV